MSKPLMDMDVNELVKLGQYHLRALKYTDETKHLARTFALAVHRLLMVFEAELHAREQLILATLPLSFSESEVRQVIESVAGMARGPFDEETAAYAVLFPRGIDLARQWHAQELLAEAVSLRERLAGEPAALDVKAWTIARLDEALTTLSDLLASRERKEMSVNRAQKQAKQARLEFIAIYERQAAAIQAIFPNPEDEGTRNCYFDERHDDYKTPPPEDADWLVALEQRGKPKPS